MVIRFQAAILDWEASVELEENLKNKLSELQMKILHTHLLEMI